MLLPWEGCRDAGSGGGCQALHPSSSSSSSSSRALLAACSLPAPPAPLPPALVPSGTLSNPAPSVCLHQEPVSLAGGDGEPQIRLATPRVPEGTAGYGHSIHQHGDPWPHGHPQHPPLCAAAPQRGETQGQSSWRLLFPWEPFPKPCSTCTSGKLHRLKEAEAALGSSDTRGVQPSFRGTKGR